ncbi:preprotein translocase subunit SecA [Lentisphaera profundi]|uniref:Protein translocase subunit SecA n=1 Tax=Lentisphaera profundi TaxID=1658616 RepID=A0ABY7VVF2_9BACT|nr:preprotein translocase subunit SecA [Lentisphaera profundi]WDE96867.1 preprotein translocase subunit SecA [Lentisphaera profundi]
MIAPILKKLFGSSNERFVKRMQPDVDAINAKEKEYQNLSEEQLKAKTQEFRDRLAKGEELNDLMVEAFATVKNTCRRLCGQEVTYMDKSEIWNMVPFDVQLMGGMIIHNGGISEMMTGEGKTLTASLPLYLNALTGKNCQLVTTNDYLAKRDSEWIGAIFRYLGLSVGCIQSMMPPDIRGEQYKCDITYGTNSEFGFDYLRDMGMAMSKEELVQRDHFFVIIDEIDSILIDEARTPLIISGPVAESTHKFDIFNPYVSRVFKEQVAICNKLIIEAREKLKSAVKDSDEFDDVIFDICKVRMGMPRNEQVIRILEDNDVRRAVEKKELFINSDANKSVLQEVKNELYFVINERQNDADLSDKGRTFMAPDDPDAYVIPDILELLQEIDSNTEYDDSQKIEKKREAQDQYEQKIEEMHNISQLLKAYCLYIKDIHYIVAPDDNGEERVVIVDENTGRAMAGRRFSEGLHQALEAKENVRIERETQTLATITIQNYFRLYDKLGGMTGTAVTEAKEFKDIYALDVVDMPTNRPCVRNDVEDRVFVTMKGKYKAIVAEVKEVNGLGRPILIGTPTVEVSEILSRFLRMEKIPHRVLNARRHQEEAEIITNAGQRGAITIATNMAGRGTDIKLTEEVVELGGLHVLGATRHDSRRIDRQLRGRCARQGDPGSSVFYVSFEDDLLRLFADRMTGILDRMKMGMDEDESIEGRMATMMIENAQKKVENQNFMIRKRTLEYDDVMNKQREIIYELRKDILVSDDPKIRLYDILNNTIEDQIHVFSTGRRGAYRVDREKLEQWLGTTFPLDFDLAAFNFEQPLEIAPLADLIIKRVISAYEEKEGQEDPERAKYLQRNIMLSALDELWIKHLRAMDSLRQNVQFAGIAQKDPLIEYKQQAFHLFTELEDDISQQILTNMFRTAVSLESIEEMLHNIPQTQQSAQDVEFENLIQQLKLMQEQEVSPEAVSIEDMMQMDAQNQAPEFIDAPPVRKPIERESPKVRPNDPCPCGSGKKYKVCHG